MSHASRSSSRPASRSRFTGLPVAAALAIVIAALITGTLISMYDQQVGSIYLLCFAVSAVVVALFVEPRGLFVTIAMTPIFFGLFTVISAWLVSQTWAADGADPFSPTAILTSLYPLTQFFPWLAWTTIICVIIGTVRIWLLRRSEDRAKQARVRQRREAAERNRIESRRAVDARRRSSQITVQELLERNRERSDRDLYNGT